MEKRRNIESKMKTLEEKNNKFLERQGKSKIEDSTDKHRYNNINHAEYSLEVYKNDLREIKNAVKELTEELRQAEEFTQETKIEYDIIKNAKKCTQHFQRDVSVAEDIPPHELPQISPQTALTGIAIKRKTKMWLDAVN